MSVYVSVFVFVCVGEGEGDIPHGVQTCARSCLMWNICPGHDQQTVSVSNGHQTENQTLRL